MKPAAELKGGDVDFPGAPDAFAFVISLVVDIVLAEADLPDGEKVMVSVETGISAEGKGIT